MIFLSWQNRRGLKPPLAWLYEFFNLLGIAAIVGCTLYIYWEWFEMSEYRAGIPNRADLVVYVTTIVVVFEICRRTSGMAIPIMVLIFIAYLLWGQYLPGIFYHSPIHLIEIIEGSFGMTGIYGLVFAALVNFIYIFIIYGAFLRTSGAGDVFVKLAYMTAGRLQGGPAHTAVWASALFGTISGSGPANVLATGTFTIPLMMKVGYRPVYAGAIEACSSTVGQIMPPVMGVSAFIMAEITGIPYSRICLASVLPAILFSYSLSILVYLEAKKSRIPLVPRKEIPAMDMRLLWKAAILLFSIATLIFMIIRGSSPAFSCLSAILALVVGSMLDRDLRMTPKKILEALHRGAQEGLPLLTLCAIIGIVVNAISSTGIGLLASQYISSIAKDSLIEALVVTMVATLILGTGLPTVPAYLLSVLAIGETLKRLGLNLLQSHLFVLYYAVLETLTPPVCLSAYTAAGISKAKPMQTGLVAFRFGMVGYIIPFIMVYNPQINFFADSYLSVLGAFLLTAAGILAFVAFERGFLVNPCTLPFRIFLLICAAALFFPLYWIKYLGLGGLICLFCWQWITRPQDEG
jgi:TRAP transporter 4TM/12TM fusion protein